MAEETRRSGRSRSNHGADARLAAIAKYKSQRVCHAFAPHRKLVALSFCASFCFTLVHHLFFLVFAKLLFGSTIRVLLESIDIRFCRCECPP
jgi:hypothetical protein